MSVNIIKRIKNTLFKSFIRLQAVKWWQKVRGVSETGKTKASKLKSYMISASNISASQTLNKHTAFKKDSNDSVN